MNKPAGTGNLQRGAAVLTWVIVSGFALWVVLRSAGGGTWWLPVVIPMGLVNLGAMWLAMDDTRAPRLRVAALWIQLASALAIGALLPVSFLPILTIIWIAMATAHFGIATCLWLLGGILLAWYVIMTQAWNEEHAVVSVLLYGTFHLFAMLSARNAHEAQAARNRAETLNRELLATQHLLSEASRQQERTRIARDLHDLLGHHLTALSLNLQIAERLSDGEAKAKIGESRALARLLLADVREAVSTLREDSAVDFTRAIRLLIDNAPGLEVELDIEDGLKIDDVEVAETLLRCVQEAITNTLRHAGANKSWIRIWRSGESLHLEVRDDGALAGDLTEGHGLTGMRERLEAIRGSLKLGNADDALSLHVEIPLPG